MSTPAVIKDEPPASIKRPTARVLVAAPFDSATTTEDVVAWQAVARREVESRGDTPLFAICAVGKQDSLPSLDIPNVEIHIIEHDVNLLETEARARAIGKLIGRARLTRIAIKIRVGVIWFLDLDVRPPDGGWSVLRDELESGAGAALIPYPLDVLKGNSGVVVTRERKTHTEDGQALVVVDARTLVADGVRPSISVIGGGFGCTAVPLKTFRAVKFVVPSPASDALLLNSDGTAWNQGIKATLMVAAGWYMNALQAQISVRAIVGMACHLAGEN